MQSISPGIVIAHLTVAGTPAILLVKTPSGWGLPVGTGGEDISSLLARVESEVFLPGRAVRLCADHRKEFSLADGTLAVEVAVSESDRLHPFIESETWHDARFSSFEEASHIIRAEHEEALRWCERAVRKVLNH